MPEYRSPNSFKPHESPYFLKEDHPQKYFRPGKLEINCVFL